MTMTLNLVHQTVVPQLSKVLNITNNILSPRNSKYMEKNPNITKSHYRKQIFVIPLVLCYIEVQL